MRLTFLGTSAANAFPEAFCRCDNCVRARALGGPSLRKRSAALVDDDLLIDLGPDVMTAAALHGRPLTNVRHCLQTHPHADHFDASHLLSRSPGYGVVGAPRLHLYASPGTARGAAKHFALNYGPGGLLDPQVGDELNLQVHQIEPLRPFDAGRYRVTAFPAEHDRPMESMLYAVQGNGRCVFYGTDTAALSEDVWAAFHRLALRFDVVALDHTYGPDEAGTSEHMNAWQVAEHVARLREEGLLAADGRAFATHVAHEGNPDHEELSRFAADHGYEVAHDGLTVLA